MRKISDFNSATEKYPVIYAGSATRPEYVDMPTTLQQQEGVAPIDTLPAQWWNAMWKLATKDINAFRDFVGNVITEINNLLTNFNITLDDADSEQLYDFFHDTYVQNYLSTFFVNVTGDTIDGDLHIKGDLSVDGIGEEVISTELKVGANTITLRNDNPSALGNTELAGVITENYDGNNNNNIIAINKNGEARTGDIDITTRILYSNDGTNFFTDEDLTTPATIGATEEVRDTGNQTSGGVEIYEGITYSNDDTQPLLTRAETNSLENGHILVWDAVNKRAVDGGSIIDRIYPVGSIYQNASNPTNPATLLGAGTWAQINDKFLAAASAASFTDGTNVPKFNNANTGGGSYTLSVANIPQHSHGMQHYHYTNISHGHGITQTEHNHTIWGSSYDGPCNVPTHVANAGITQLHPWTCGGAMANISVNDLAYNDAWKYSEGSVSDATSTPRTSTDNWGTASPTAISIIPSYQAVYTWKRTA